jgi:hypothetical protein
VAIGVLQSGKRQSAVLSFALSTLIFDEEIRDKRAPKRRHSLPRYSVLVGGKKRRRVPPCEGVSLRIGVSYYWCC